MAKQRNYKMLVEFRFYTHDDSYPVDSYFVIVDGGDRRVDADTIRLFMPNESEKSFSEDYEYEDFVQDTLEKCPYEWEWVLDCIPACDSGIMTIEVE